MDFGQYGLAESDIQFLKQKLDEGNLVTAHNSRTTTGEICAITPASGKIFYHVKSYITLIGTEDTNGANTEVKVSLQNDGTTKDILGGSGLNNANTGFFNQAVGTVTRNHSDLPDKLIGDGAKKYRLNVDSTSSASITVYGTIIGYYEDA